MAIKITDEMKTDFLVYAQEVNQNRSFPDVRDGLKPSQRAALYTMFRKGFTVDKPHVKSAKITGAVIGELWPHGDGSAYESIVRMSQPWINNLSEVDFHGANGSLLGGPEAASSRYTECRLSRLCEDGFFSNIKKNTVDFIPNFSEDDEWPIVFPAIFPRLIVNGSQGIGYTIAQEWEPTNLKEFTNKVKEYIKNGKVNCNDIYPDYPTGGIIINKKDVHNIYETGKGSIILRGKVSIEDNIIKITELPYQVYAEPLIQKIKDLVNNEQITGIEDICNKSDDDGLLIEIECSSDPEYILNRIYTLTDLQCTFSANMMALLDGVPQMFTLKDYIKTYVEHNINCIVREYTYDLDKATKRLEIVEGLINCIKMIDKVIDTIKKSKSSEAARENLQKQYKFTENQARAIVDMRLGKLANMESKELEDEQISLNKTIEACNKLLSSKSNQTKEFTKRLDAFVDKYGWERRTSLDDIDVVKERAVVKATKPKYEDCIIALTKGNTIKRIALTNYKAQTKVNSEEDRIIKTLKIGTHDKFVLIGASGMMYKLQANKVSQCNINSAGDDLNTIFNDMIVDIYTGKEEDKYLFFITNNGNVKKIETKVVFSISKGVGSLIMKLEDNNKIIYSKLVNDKDIIKYTVANKEKILDTSKFKAKGRGAGGQAGIKYKEGQEFIIA